MEHLLKNAAMRSDDEGSYEELEKELLGFGGMTRTKSGCAL